MNISIIGQGNMANAIKSHLQDAGHTVTLIGRDVPDTLDSLVILAIPYAAHQQFVADHQAKLSDKIIIDISNPVNFQTLDTLVVPQGESAASLLQQALPSSRILKAFNTTSAFMLNAKKVADRDAPTVLIAGDDADAKHILITALQGSSLNAVDVGSLQQAKQLEALGMLQMYLVKNGITAKTGGFSLLGLTSDKQLITPQQ